MSDIERKGSIPQPVQYERIEINFAIPVYLYEHEMHELHDWISAIVKKRYNQVVGHSHWLSEVGSKPKWSKNDARLLGITDPSSVSDRESGEPDFDDSILTFSTTCIPKETK